MNVQGPPDFTAKGYVEEMGYNGGRWFVIITSTDGQDLQEEEKYCELISK